MDRDHWEPLSALPRCLRDGGGDVCGSARPLASGQRPGGSEGRGAGVFLWSLCFLCGGVFGWGGDVFVCSLCFSVTPPVSRVRSSHRADSTCPELEGDRDLVGIGSLSGSCLFSLLDCSQDLDSAVRGGTPAGEQCGPESRGRVQASGATVSNVCRGRAREGAHARVGPTRGLDVASAPRGIDAAWRCDPRRGLRCRDTSVRLPEFPRGIVFSRKKQEEPASEPPCGAQSGTREGRGGDGQPLLGGGLCY